MSNRRAVIGCGLSLGLGAMLYAALALGGSEEKSPPAESLLPADAVLYVTRAGGTELQQAWEQTAAYDAVEKTGLNDTIDALITSVAELAAGDVDPRFHEALRRIDQHGFSLAVSLPDREGPPMPFGVLILHEGADAEPLLEQRLPALIDSRFRPTERQVESRTVTAGMLPPIGELGWWTEGRHLVIVVGPDSVNAAIAVAAGKSSNITTSPLWKKYGPTSSEFAVRHAGWIDLGRLRQMAALLPVPAQDDRTASAGEILSALGLDQLGVLAHRSGYKGRSLWSETRLEAPAPRQGLLDLTVAAPIALDDLPPLPERLSAFRAYRADPAQIYERFTKVAEGVAATGVFASREQVAQAVDSFQQKLGIDLQADLLDPLGDVVCLYSDPGQELLGMGTAIAISVDDADQVRRSLDALLERAVEQAPEIIAVERVEKSGRDVMLLKVGGTVPVAAIAVHDKWLIAASLPQTVETFLLRLDGKLPAWTPSDEFRAALAELPRDPIAISSTDPRETYRVVAKLAPLGLQMLLSTLQEAELIQPGEELSVSLADIPPAELVTRPLFPNVSVCTADEHGFHWTSRRSFPDLPLTNGIVSVSGVSTTAVGVALLLPAVQQAREAARRTQSRSNLHQFGLALHNYHDVYQHFPTGTVPNEKLKPENRLSWQASILPYVDEAPLYQMVDFDDAWNSEANRDKMKRAVRMYLNPGVAKDPHEYAVTHYVGIAGHGDDAPLLPVGHRRAGIFGYNRKTSIRDVTDGSSNTLLTSEASKDFGAWGAGGQPTVRAFTKKPYINGPDGIGGPFRGGCHMGMADGSVHFVSENVDPKVLEALSTAAGGEVVGGF